MTWTPPIRDRDVQILSVTLDYLLGVGAFFRRDAPLTAFPPPGAGRRVVRMELIVALDAVGPVEVELRQTGAGAIALSLPNVPLDHARDVVDAILAVKEQLLRADHPGWFRAAEGLEEDAEQRKVVRGS